MLIFKRKFEIPVKENCELKFWKDDEDGINDDLNEDMAFGIENSRLVLVFMSEPYFTSKNCRKEFNYADVLDKGRLILVQKLTSLSQS